MHCSVEGTQRAWVEHGCSKSRWTLIASCQWKEASEQKPNYNDQIWMHTWARHPVLPQPPHVHWHLDPSCRNLSMTARFWIQPKGQYHVGISEYKIITHLSQNHSFWVNPRQWRMTLTMPWWERMGKRGRVLGSATGQRYLLLLSLDNTIKLVGTVHSRVVLGSLVTAHIFSMTIGKFISSHNDFTPYQLLVYISTYSSFHWGLWPQT